jgi:hypothetical protein
VHHSSWCGQVGGREVQPTSGGYKSIKTVVNVQSNVQNFRKNNKALGFMKLILLRTTHRHFNWCFTVHFDKFKAFLVTNARLIKT